MQRCVEATRATGISFERADASGQPLRTRALLLVWPNNPDRWYNPHVAPRSSPTTPCWDAACAEGYLAAGGRRIIYVGETEYHGIR